MLNTLSLFQQPAEPDDEGFPVDWELTTTVTASPVPIVEACGSGDGCKSTCASSCISS
ncbi:FxLD family lantipeptide [Streptomyces albogriseolus]|uniref:FxLD family lantipeptide n=1 Tax=Streptomyces albogriseolus TaxID=1887 RepID=UPI0037FA8233